jgi:hypothetical protein
VDFDVGIALVILQAHVEARAVALDQVHLQDERFQLRPDHDPFDVRDFAHQATGLVVVAGIGVEIRTHPRAQIDRLAHVNDRAFGIFHDVTAGFVGNVFRIPGCVRKFPCGLF